MVKDLYQKSFSVLMKRPFRLWGLSLLAGVLLLAAQVGFVGASSGSQRRDTDRRSEVVRKNHDR